MFKTTPLDITNLREYLARSVKETNTAAKTPFDLHPVVETPMSRDEYLGLLRDRINKGYMPSSSGRTQYNSKPEYIQNLDTSSPAVLCRRFSCDGSGYFSEDTYGLGQHVRTIWHWMDLGEFGVLVDLTTDQTWVGLCGATVYGVSEWTDQLISVDRCVLLDKIDTYC